MSLLIDHKVSRVLTAFLLFGGINTIGEFVTSKVGKPEAVVKQPG